MGKYFSAQIDWISLENGGRKTIPPDGTRYSPIIKVADKDFYGDWSVDFICTKIINGNQMIVNLSFLSPNAPESMLEKGKKIYLLEGDKKVATGLIL